MEIEEFDNELCAILPEDRDTRWLVRRLRKEGSASVSKVFRVTPSNVVEGLEQDDERFVIRIAERHGEYWKMDSDILEIDFDLYLSTANKWKRKHFVAEKAVRIFPRLNDIVSESMWIGGNYPDSIPFTTYDRFIRKLPSYTELHKYVAARLANSAREHFSVKGDPERQYEEFLNKRIHSTRSTKAIESPIEELVSGAEVEKFTLLIGRLKEMLEHAISYSEARWQQEILAIIRLLFPKYVVVLESVPVRDLSGNLRQIDLGLLDVEGNIDVVEIKKPFDACVMSKSQYRNNYVPLRELSGSIMQVEKYILYLQRGGIQQDRKIQAKFGSLLKDGPEIKVVNPRGLVILGRSNTLNDKQRGDFEVVRRKYAHIADIITYDDLLQRLETVRDHFKKLRL